MVDAHLTDDQLKAYRERRLRGGDFRAASDHIARCSHCESRMSGSTGIAASYERLHAALLDEEHLAQQEFAAYADGTATEEDRERIAAHARDCAECAAEIAAYRELRRQIEGQNLASGALNRPSIREQVAKLLARPGWRLTWAAAGAAACLVIFLLLRNPSERASAPITAEQHSPRAADPTTGSLALRDGNRTLSIEAGQVSGIGDLPPAWRRHIEVALVNGHLDARFDPELRGRAGTLLAVDSAPVASATLLAPVGVSVESATPRFAWKGRSASKYRIEVFDADFQPVATSDWIVGDEWQPAMALARGRVYAWQLTVRRDGRETKIPAPPAPEARFRIISDAEARELAEARRLYPGFRLLHAVLYARAGIIEQSRTELTRLQAGNPQSQALAKLMVSLDPLNSPQTGARPRR
jgi:hypothetical protein